MSGQEENQKYQIPFGKNQPWANESAGDSTPSGGSGISAGNAGGNSSDNAQQIYYFNNQVVAPTGTYTYDALYRLISATGRELNSLGMPSHEDFPDDIPCPNPMADAMQNYTQYYRYDELGNILQLQSDGNQSHWIRDYIYDTATNRLLRHSGTTDEYWYDQHGNIIGMPHLRFLRWDYKDQFYNTSNGTYSSFYSYDAQGNRTRKVIDKNNIIETRYYLDGFELYRREVNGAIDYERTTLNISDDEKVFVRVEKKTNEPEIVRYQYDNHLGSACLELDYTGRIISYEEYHPFGTTSYRSGRSETEVSLKRYKYCGKERDEQTGFYYYGMRYYAAWLCRFVSVDPMADEYPSLTPYNYCANNPLILTDPNGADWDPDVNEETMTITIRATYYTLNKDKDKVQEGVDLWNAQSGKYSYTTGEGDNQKSYIVNFDLKVVSFETEREMADAFHRDRESNMFQVNNELVPEKARGVASDGYDIRVRSDAPSRTFAHEMGHTLGLDDTPRTGGHDDGIDVMQSGGTGNIIKKSHIMGILNASGITTTGEGAPTTPEAKPKRKYNMTGTLKAVITPKAKPKQKRYIKKKKTK